MEEENTYSQEDVKKLVMAVKKSTDWLLEYYIDRYDPNMAYDKRGIQTKETVKEIVIDIFVNLKSADRIDLLEDLHDRWITKEFIEVMNKLTGDDRRCRKHNTS